MKIIATKDFTLKGKLYNAGEEIKPPKDYLIKLNEEGYIEPINIEDIDSYDETEAIGVKENVETIVELTQKDEEDNLEIVKDEITEKLTEETILEEETEEKEVEVKEKKIKTKKEEVQE